MSKLRWGIALTVIVASLIATTAVFGSSKPKAKASASNTLTILSQLALKPGTDNMIAGFKKANPGVDVRVTYAPSTTIHGTLLTTQINAGNPPDITLVQPGNSGSASTVPLAKAGKLIDLSKESWVNKIPKSIRDGGKYKGKFYSFPITNYFTGMLYSKTIFKKAGVKVPQTMADMVKVCKTVKAKTGVTPIGLSIADSSTAAVELWAVAAQYVWGVKRNWNDLREKGKVKFATSKEWKNVFKAFGQMKDAGCFSPGVAGTTGTQAKKDIETGKTAMYLYVNVTLATERLLGAQNGQDIAFFSLPGASAKTHVVPFGSSSIAATSKDNVALAKKYMAFIAAPSNNNGYNKISGGISYTNLSRGKLPAGNEAVAKLAKKKQIPAVYTDWPNAQEIYWLGSALQAWFTGQKSVDQILKGADYMWDNPNSSTPPGG